MRIGAGGQRGLTTHGTTEAPGDQIFSTHYFGPMAQGGMQSQKGRMKRLIMVVTTLKTDLAEVIFVKHAMSRPDLMKCVNSNDDVRLSRFEDQI
jgi:hypothetical protein